MIKPFDRKGNVWLLNFIKEIATADHVNWKKEHKVTWEKSILGDSQTYARRCGTAQA